ncbi:MAG: Daunorubicin/doxorubicin resistance ATP-binding protein DrrA [Candidatus Heimdallarchaeota archaeon LC_3]|nr:MAG: Daunorubicin/doxorubicin resistance ATP-binding protein DrrA [Candidatus Heimdallarchaeota archaeon LC_3]OLS20497.1 MAG: Daunorubicin/doxorubicin resistance ATP-binding protein DrrA [Candidatus Heimdallarchaeota archaeon LC_3]
MKIVEIDNVTKIYDGIIVAASDCNFSLSQGITGFLGPNGSGKSTIINTIVGELKPTLGEIRVFNQNPWNNPELNRKIGYISEINSHFDFLTPIKFIVAIAKIGGFSRQKAIDRAEYVLDLVGMEHFHHRKLTQLSKGMKQRIKIANAFLFNPEFIVADEPLSGLDPMGRNLVFNIFQDFASNGGSVFLSSHILFEVERITKDLILIYNGQIVAQGKTREIREKLSEYPYHFEITSNNPLDLAKLLLEEFAIIKSVEIKSGTNNDSKPLEIDKTKESNHEYKKIDSILVTTIKPSILFDLLAKINLETGIKIYSMVNLEEQAETESIFNYIINS